MNMLPAPVYNFAIKSLSETVGTGPAKRALVIDKIESCAY